MEALDRLTRRELLRFAAAVGANLILPSRTSGDVELAEIDLAEIFKQKMRYYMGNDISGNNTALSILSASSEDDEDFDKKILRYLGEDISGNNTALSILSASSEYDEDFDKKILRYFGNDISGNNTALSILISASYLTKIKLKSLIGLYYGNDISGNNTALSLLSASSEDDEDFDKKILRYLGNDLSGNNTALASMIAVADDEPSINQMISSYQSNDLSGNNTALALLIAGAAFQYRLQTELCRRYPGAKTVADIPANGYQGLRDQYNVLRVFGIYPRRSVRHGGDKRDRNESD
jgi:hypothetical protein